ncbi:MAG: hypothetical protein JO002_13140, partial [Burkholderiaceae bacterium]|nr:hypothetical protein [Burkholderiaceae bacterium]
MALKNIPSVAVVATLLLGGCAFADNALFPPLAPVGGTGSGKLVLASAEGSDASYESTGTFVGQKVESLRNDLHQLQSNIGSERDQLQSLREQVIKDSQGYHGTIATIEARLQLGTTPGNPILVQAWNDAQSSLDAINEDVLKMSRLATEVASTSGMAAYLVESV